MTHWKHADWITIRGELWVSDAGCVERRGSSYISKSGSGLAYQTKPKDRRVAPAVHSNGYLLVTVTSDGVRHKLYVHRLVARLFVPGYEASLSVNHIDGDKSNNSAANLEWVTLSENTRKQWNSGLLNTRGERHYGTKLTASDVVAIRERRRRGETYMTIAADYKMSISGIHTICSGKTWRE